MMKQTWIKFLKWMDGIQESPLKVALTLGVVCLFGYGLMLPFLGLFTDDWVFIWSYNRMGIEGLQSYFSTNRPVWGLLYQLSIPILGYQPMVWHLFGLFWHWAASFAFWGMLRVVWPQQRRQIFWVALVFLLYPGFAIQYISLTVGHMWLVYTIFMVSMLLTGLALRTLKRQPGYWMKNRRFWLYSGAGLLFSLANTLFMEYFLPLELTRFLLIFVILRDDLAGFWKPAWRTLLHWLPYAVVLLVVVIWRAFFFKVQTYYYDLSFITRLKVNPIEALWSLLQRMGSDIYEATAGAWARLVGAPLEFKPSGTILVLYAAVVVGAVFLFALLLIRRRKDEQGFGRRDWGWQAILFGFLSMLTAGWPFWVTELTVIPAYFSSRFTMPFILGSSLVLIGVLELIPWRVWRSAILALALGGAVGTHLLIANDFRLDWIQNKRMIQQFAERVPGLVPGTLIFMTDDNYNLRYFSSATIAAQINLLYPPVEGVDAPYAVVFTRSVPDLKFATKETAFQLGMVTSTFYGKYGQSIFVYTPPAQCLWVMDDDVYLDDSALDAVWGKVNDRWIIAEKTSPYAAQTRTVFAQVWELDRPDAPDCILFEQAGLAYQEKNWEEANRIGEELRERQSELLGRKHGLLFIDSYARAGLFSKAVELTDFHISIRAADQKSICRLWNRLEIVLPESADKAATMMKVRNTWCPK